METMLDRIADYLRAQSWQIAVLVTVVALVSWILRHRSAHVRYLLWLVVLAKCLVPPMVNVPLAVLPEPVVQAEAPVVLPPIAEAPAVIPPSVAPRTETQPLPALPAATPARRPLDLQQRLVLAWLAGVAAFVLIASVKIGRTVSWLRRQRRPLPSELQTRIGTLLSSHSRKLPRMWLIDGMGQPFVWGLLRGDIYLPLSFPALGHDEHRRSVLGHELCHVWRFDAAINALQIAAQAVFWFHPLVWWANRKMRQEREKACDEMAVARLGARPKDYSTALVTTLIQAQESTRSVPSLAVAGSVKNIEERIRAMLRPGKKFYQRPSLIAATTVLLAATLTVPTALVLTARARTASSDAKSNSPQTLHQAAAAGDKEQVQKLLAQGADIHAKDEDGRTPLHTAAWYARKDVMEMLLARGANVNEADGSGQTPLHSAANSAWQHVSELLLAHGAQIDARDKAGNTPLHAAANQVNVGKDLLEFLIAKGADVKARNEAGQTPLHRVSMIRRLDRHLERTAEALLDLGAEVDAKDQSGRTPLHFAVGTGHRELVDLLLAKGADIKTRAADGTNLLHQAVKSGQIDMVERILSRGIDINSADSEGITPLHYAAQRGDNETLERLIAKGANVNAKGARGWTPALLAAMWARRDTVTLLLSKGADISSIQLAAYLGDLARVKAFLENEVDVNTPGILSPLHAAALGDQKEVAEFLLSKGASVNADAAIPSGTTPLHCAALAGSRDVVELLIDHGADVNAEAGVQQKMRPLDFAVRSARNDMAKWLIDKGADTSQPDVLLFQACRQVDRDLVELLIRKGADVNSKAWGDADAPAMEAIWSGYTKATKPADVPRLLGVLEVLLDHGADPDAKDRWDWSLLHYACGNVDLTRLLLDRGANPNVRTAWGGRTPLHFVADEGNKAVTQLLLSRGADVNAKASDGDTPLSCAEDLGDNDMWGNPRKTPLTAEAKAAKQEVARLLREHGAKE